MEVYVAVGGWSRRSFQFPTLVPGREMPRRGAAGAFVLECGPAESRSSV